MRISGWSSDVCSSDLRQRILIVGCREKTDFTFDDVHLPDDQPTMVSILHPQDGSEEPEAHYTVGPKAKVDKRYTLTPNLWAYLQNYAAKHSSDERRVGKECVRTCRSRW